MYIMRKRELLLHALLPGDIICEGLILPQPMEHENISKSAENVPYLMFKYVPMQQARNTSDHEWVALLEV